MSEGQKGQRGCQGGGRACTSLPAPCMQGLGVPQGAKVPGPKASHDQYLLPASGVSLGRSALPPGTGRGWQEVKLPGLQLAQRELPDRADPRVPGWGVGGGGRKGAGYKASCYLFHGGLVSPGTSEGRPGGDLGAFSASRPCTLRSWGTRHGPGPDSATCPVCSHPAARGGTRTAEGGGKSLHLLVWAQGGAGEREGWRGGSRGGFEGKGEKRPLGDLMSKALDTAGH